MFSKRAEHHVGENGQIEVVRNPSLGLLLSCGTDMNNNSFMFSHSEEEEEEEEEEESRDDEIPNRRNSIMDDDEEEEEEYESVDDPKEGVEVTLSQEETRSYHPALKPAVLAEGQEAMWIEDEVSTVASVYVKPEKKENEKEAKKKSRFRFRQLAPVITIPEDEELQQDEENAQKVHVRKSKVLKTVVLLPQQEDEGTKTLVEANVKQEAAVNMIKARQLLNQALIAVEEGSRLEDSEALAKVAFAHAAVARRLMSKPDEEPDLEEVLSVLAEKGELAAFEHQKIVFSQSFGSQSAESEQKAKKKGVLSAASEYASRAMHYLESILPTNIERELQESVSDEDIMAMETISTLGFKSDTFEYKMTSAPSNPTKSYTNMDLMSISSLNEILDGPMDDANDKPPSPRQFLPVIKIPNSCTPKTKPSSRSVRRSISGELKKWVSPRSPFVSKFSSQKADEFQGVSLKESITIPLDEDQLNPAESTDVINAPSKQKKKWGILGKMRRGKVSKPAEVESKHSSDDSEFEDVPPKDPHAIDSFPTGPSKTFESEDRNSNHSRYHVIREKSSEDVRSANSRSEDVGAANSRCEESHQDKGSRGLNTSKSDWDYSVDFEKAKVKVAPSRSRYNVTARDPSTENLKQSDKECLATSSSTDQESASEDLAPKKQEETTSRTPSSHWGASVDSQRTMDFRSTQGNAGVTVAGTEAEQSQSQSETESKMDDEIHTQASVTEPSGSKARSTVSTTVSQKPVYKKLREPYPSEESTQAGIDSLIDFVISPRRADIITPEGHRHIESDRGDEPSRIMIPVLHAIDEYHVIGEKNIASIDEEDSEILSIAKYEAKSQHKYPTIINRISGLFGPRKGPGQNKGESFDSIQKKHSDDDYKDIERAVSDGNGKAYEANLNAENAVSPYFQKQGNRYWKSSTVVSSESTSLHESKESTIDPISESAGGETPIEYEDALNHAISKAEEANLEVDTAPFPHRKARRKHKSSQPVPLDLVDAIRMQAGLERNKNNNGRMSTGDAPGTSSHPEIKTRESLRLDPPKEDGAGYRVLAPTPRKKDNSGENQSSTPTAKTQDENKHDQRTISERLYGASTSTDEDFFPHHVKNNKIAAAKGVYIGDLIGSVNVTPKPLAATETNETDDEPVPASESIEQDATSEDVPGDKENDTSLPLTSPKGSSSNITPRRRFGAMRNVTAGAKGGRRSALLAGIRNMMSSEQ